MNACNSDAATTVLQAAAGPAVAAQAMWLDAGRLRWPAADPLRPVQLLHAAGGGLVTATGQAPSGLEDSITMSAADAAVPEPQTARFAWFGSGPEYRLSRDDAVRLPALLLGQLRLVQTDDQGRVLRASSVQIAAALDDLYAASAARAGDLGATPSHDATGFALWAPTAQAVSVCLREAGGVMPVPMARDAASGIWRATVPRDLSGALYTYAVDVLVEGHGLVRNRVTDPYSVSLDADSQHSWIGRMDDPSVTPEGWAGDRPPQTVQHGTDTVMYELHVRDFSANDDSVRPAWRGKYLAFTEPDSAGMRHLRALAAAGVTDVHLLPVFDFATVPDTGCTQPDTQRLSAMPPGSDQQQALVMQTAATDCFNWGYDPWHFGAPEGSYATDAANGAVRILELRRLVQALHRAGLRVGMDVVYNHTHAAGQNPQSVLDRIVPGYYQRLDANGTVTNSTCCANTATEHAMMAKLMTDTAVVWARDHHIDGFRFDLMGHQPRSAMLALQAAVDRATGRHVQLIGEGWNFGEVQNGARFVQAAQGRLGGTGIGTFSDRARDALRGSSDGAALSSQQGWLTGLGYAPNAHAPADPAAQRNALMKSADLVRVGLAGTLADVRLQTHDGSVKPLREIEYSGQGAGYAQQPDEAVAYVENHDNPTLFDLAVWKLPRDTSRADRARVQVLGVAAVLFSQGIPYLHAGIELLRSKSLDRNSYDSGDWFNRIDWTASSSAFGSGLPPARDNEPMWPAMRPLLADREAIAPSATDIAFTRDAVLDLLRIRRSSTLFRLPTAAEIEARLSFLDTGPAQEPAVVIVRLDGRGWPGAGFDELLLAINADVRAHSRPLPELKGRGYGLHPVHLAPDAADRRPAAEARWDADAALLQVPSRTAVAWVLPAAR